MKQPAKILKIGSVCALIALFTGCARTASTDSQEKPHPPERLPGEVLLPPSQQAGLVETRILEMSSQPELLDAPGKIMLNDNSNWRVGVLTPGRVEKVYVSLGDFVHQNQVLARMHSHDVHDARAADQTAHSSLARAEMAEALAQKTYERAERLYALKAGSLAEVERARQEMVNAQAVVRQEQIELDKEHIHLEGNLGVVADPGPGIPEDEADLVPIRAPGTGYILAKNVTPGTVVDPAKDLFEIGELHHLWMLASVGGSNIARVHVGQQATVTTNAFPGDRFPGKVTNLGPELDPTTRVMKVRIELENPEIKLRPEMLANAQIEVGRPRPLLLLPAEAVQQVNDQDVVFIRTQKDRFEMRAVRLGEKFNSQVVALEGVDPGQVLVTRGSFLLKSELLKASLEAN